MGVRNWTHDLCHGRVLPLIHLCFPIADSIDIDFYLTKWLFEANSLIPVKRKLLAQKRIKMTLGEIHQKTSYRVIGVLIKHVMETSSSSMICFLLIHSYTYCGKIDFCETVWGWVLKFGRVLIFAWKKTIWQQYV